MTDMELIKLAEEEGFRAAVISAKEDRVVYLD